MSKIFVWLGTLVYYTMKDSRVSNFYSFLFFRELDQTCKVQVSLVLNDLLKMHLICFRTKLSNINNPMHAANTTGIQMLPQKMFYSNFFCLLCTDFTCNMVKCLCCWGTILKSHTGQCRQWCSQTVKSICLPTKKKNNKKTRLPWKLVSILATPPTLTPSSF